MEKRDKAPKGGKKFKCAICFAAKKPEKVWSGHSTEYCRDAKKPEKSQSSPVAVVDVPAVIREAQVAAGAVPLEPGEIDAQEVEYEQQAQALVAKAALSPLPVYLAAEFAYANQVGIPATFMQSIDSQSPDVNPHGRAALARKYACRSALAELYKRGVRHVEDLYGNDRTKTIAKQLVPSTCPPLKVTITGQAIDPADQSRRANANPDIGSCDALFLCNVYQHVVDGESVVLSSRVLAALMKQRGYVDCAMVRHTFLGDANSVSGQSAWVRHKTTGNIVMRADAGSAPYDHPVSSDFDVSGAFDAGDDSICWTTTVKADIAVIMVQRGAVSKLFKPTSAPEGRFQRTKVDISELDNWATALLRRAAASAASSAIPGARYLSEWYEAGTGARERLVDLQTSRTLVSQYLARMVSAYTYASFASAAVAQMAADPACVIMAQLFPAEMASLATDTAMHAFIAVGTDTSAEALAVRHGDAIAERNSAVGSIGKARPTVVSRSLFTVLLFISAAMMGWRLALPLLDWFRRASRSTAASLVETLPGTAIARALQPQHPALRALRQVAASRTMQVVLPRVANAAAVAAEATEHLPAFMNHRALARVVNAVGLGQAHSLRFALARLAPAFMAHALANAPFGWVAVLDACCEEAARLLALTLSPTAGRCFTVAIIVAESFTRTWSSALGNAVFHVVMHVLCELALTRRPAPDPRPDLPTTTEFGVWWSQFDKNRPNIAPRYDALRSFPVPADGVHNVIYKRSSPPTDKVKPLPPRNVNSVIRTKGYPSSRPSSELVHYLGGLAVPHNVFGRTDDNLLSMVHHRIMKDVGRTDDDQNMIWTGIQPLTWHLASPLFGDMPVAPAFIMVSAFVRMWALRDLVGCPRVCVGRRLYPPTGVDAAEPIVGPVVGHERVPEEARRIAEQAGRMALAEAAPTIVRTPEVVTTYAAGLTAASRVRFTRGLDAIANGALDPASVTKTVAIGKTNDDLLKEDAIIRPIYVVSEQVFASVAPELSLAVEVLDSVFGAAVVVPQLALGLFPPAHWMLTEPNSRRVHVFYVAFCNSSSTEVMVQVPHAMGRLAREVARNGVYNCYGQGGVELDVVAHLILAAGDDTHHAEYETLNGKLTLDMGDLSSCDLTVGSGPLVAGSIVFCAAGLPQHCALLLDRVSRSATAVQGTDGFSALIDSPPSVHTGDPATGKRNSVVVAAAQIASATSGDREAAFHELGMKYKSRRKVVWCDQVDPYDTVVRAYHGTDMLKCVWAPVTAWVKDVEHQATAFPPLDSRALKFKCIKDPRTLYTRGLTYEEAALAFMADLAKTYEACIHGPVVAAFVHKWLELESAPRRSRDMSEEDPRQPWRPKLSRTVALEDGTICALDEAQWTWGQAFADMYDELYGVGSWIMACDLADAVEAQPPLTLFESPLVNRLLRDYA